MKDTKQNNIQLLLITLLLLSVSMVSLGQGLNGTIADGKGVSIPYATIYVKELSVGTVSNLEGRYEIDLEQGDYTLIFRSLGYKTKTVKVTIDQTTVQSKDITLQEQLNELQEVRITANGEDPANPIMRKAIALANFHLRQVNSYEADVYMRSRLKLTNVPRLVASQLKRREGIDIKEGKTYVDETFSKIQFTAPDKYAQTVLSHNTTLPAFKDISVMEYVGASFYQPTIEILISPFAPNAFSHYKFTYEGYNIDGDYMVNIIKVTPKRKSKQLFKGYLHIIDQLSCLHSVDLWFSTPFGDMKTKQIFEEVRPTVWLPIGHSYFFNGGALGLKGSITYNANFKYKKLSLNKKLLALQGRTEAYKASSPAIVQQEKHKEEDKRQKMQSQAEVKRMKKIAELSKKEDISKSEMDKLNKLIAKENIKKDRETRTSLEIIPKAKVEYLQEADQTKSTDWMELRAIPLTQEEQKSFADRDSIAKEKEESITIAGKSVKTPKFIKSVGRVVGGKKWYNNKQSWTFRYPGLLSPDNMVFNPVDGFNYGLSMSAEHQIKEGYSLYFEPKASYAFSREQFLWQMKSKYYYAPLRMGEMQLTFGHQTSDFNQRYAINPLVNSLSCLFFQDNFKRHFDNEFISFWNRYELIEGLVSDVTVSYSNREQLTNNTNFSFFDQQGAYRSNVPRNAEIGAENLMGGKNFVTGFRLTYTHEHFYKMKHGRKRTSKSKYPSVWLEYKKGWDLGDDYTSDFDFMELGVRQKVSTAASAWLQYSARAGMFFRDDAVHFTDFAHFNVRPVPFMINDPRLCFFGNHAYELSTKEQYFNAHIWYRAPYILLKRLPFFSNSLIREQIWGSYYTNINRKHVWEVGYALTELLFLGDLGVYANFEEEEFQTVGVFLHLDL